MGKPVLYLDILFLINLAVNFLLLSVTKTFLVKRARPWRILLGAAIGGASSLCILLPTLTAFQMLVFRVLFAILMVFVSFGFCPVLPFLKRVATLFFTSIGFAGIMFLIHNLWSPGGLQMINGVVYFNLSPLQLLGYTVAAYLLLTLYDRFIAKQRGSADTVTIAITFLGKTVRVEGFADTGCSLTEPFSGKPVLIVRSADIAALLPEAERDRFFFAATSAEALSASSEGALKNRVRIIPYEGVGIKSLLPAFLPDQITITERGGTSYDCDGYVAVTDQLSIEEKTALVNPKMAVRR